MRQIITPLPNVVEQRQRRKSRSRRSARSTPTDSEEDNSSKKTSTKASPRPLPSRQRGQKFLSASECCLPRESSESHVESDGLVTPPTHDLFSSNDSLSPFLALSDSSTEDGQPNPWTLDGLDLEIFNVPDSTLFDVVPPTPLFNDEESSLLALFLEEIPKLLPYSELFPSVCNDICAMSATHVPLTQSILAISSSLASRRNAVTSICAFTYLENALSQIQERIAIGKVDDGLIASVFLLAFLSTIDNDYKSARRHLLGLSQLLKIYHHARTSSPSPRQTASVDGYPVIMLLWRMAIRLDYVVAFHTPFHEPLIFSISPELSDSNQVHWISQLVNNLIPDGVNWALATFALDDLLNQTSHLSSTSYEATLERVDRDIQFQHLLEQQLDWKNRSIIIHSTQDTANLSNSQYDPASKGLYKKLLFRHFMIGIYLSLTSNQGLSLVPPPRLQAAIQKCQQFIARGVDASFTYDDATMRLVENCSSPVSMGLGVKHKNCANDAEFTFKALTAIARETGSRRLLDVLEIMKAVNGNRESRLMAKGVVEGGVPTGEIVWPEIGVSYSRTSRDSSTM